MKTISGVVMVGLLGLLGCTEGLEAVKAPVGSSESDARQKVVYHIDYDEPKQQTAALRNIQNHINAVGKENLDLRVVMHGNGVSLILLPEARDKVKGFRHANADPQMQAAIGNLKIQGVKFDVCANTLKGRKVAIDQLYDARDADIVPSGVAELAHLQGQGFTYIKP